MAVRGYGIHTLTTGTAVPAFGTTLSAAITPTPDPYRGNYSVGGNQSYGTVTVADPNAFRSGDRVLVGASATFGFNPATPPDQASIQSINYGTSTLTLQGLTRTHASGEFIVLAITVQCVRIQAGPANTALLFIGEDNTVAVGSKTLAFQISGGAGSMAAAGVSYLLGDSGSGPIWDTSHLWVSGTTSDTFIPSVIL